jgi:alkanesulfonate monooxygenase SsuD/methylene tetrahydromethanopterin reductase-like flavin-dependent oxidoreductase (luciferase family)
MEVGIGLPNAIRGGTRDSVVEWARRAETAGFSTLGTIDRISYGNYESLIALAAASAVTERIRLMTDILLAPLRNPAQLAKQAATLDSISDGRLVLGLAPGGREDDYEVSGVPFHERGALFDRQIPQMKDIWSGGTGIGPEPAQPGGPSLLFGGRAAAGFRRAAQYGDGWTMGGGTPEDFRELKARAEAAWKEHGRDGAPRTMALFYGVVGPDAEDAAKSYLLDYYADLGEETAGLIVAGAAKDPEAIKGRLSAFEAEGADEVIIFPCSHSLEQVDLLAEVAL